MRWLWESSRWPDLEWDDGAVLARLAVLRRVQGMLLGEADSLGLEVQADLLTEESVETAAIEGERLDRDAVRSSVARRLGLPEAGAGRLDRHADGVVRVLIEATRDWDVELTPERVWSWHAALFPTGRSGTARIRAGAWRDGGDPMQVVSGPIGRERVHFQAPPATRVGREMAGFFVWWRSSRGTLDGVLRAALAHLRFVTIHPFDDGNGRIARALTDLALAQDERDARRLYSMSARISSERSAYYSALERTQRGSGDATAWLLWFLGCLELSVEASRRQIGKVLRADRVWRRLRDAGLNERQRKVLARLIEAEPEGFEGGLTNRKYVGMTRTSRESAKRDIADLVARGILARLPGGGRSASYSLDPALTGRS